MTLSAATWNLNGLDERLLDERTEAACFHLLAGPSRPDVVLLQEVVRRSFFAHLRPHFSAAGYTLAPAEPVSDSEYFCAIAVAPTLRPTGAWRRRFPGSSMGRALLALEVDWAGRPLLVCTAHLESLRSGAAQRRQQVVAVADALRSHEGPALYGGDTNLRSDGLAVLEEHGVDDAWEVLGRPGAKATWWPMEAKRPSGRRMRFDRFWSHGLVPEAIDVGGPVAVGELSASDHRVVRGRWR